MAEGFLIYSTPGCKWCVLARNLLATLGEPWVEVDVTKDEQAKARLKAMGIRTVPQIWHGEEHIGGYANLEMWTEAREAARAG